MATQAAGSSPTRALLLRDVKMVVLCVAYAFDIIHQPGIIHTGSSRHRASYEIVIKSDRLDVKASDMLLTSDADDFVAPIMGGEIELQGVIYPLMKAQPGLNRII
jgi:hypothetical protein